MGYWEPPPPSVFDPAPRPLRHDRSGAPSDEDYVLFIDANNGLAGGLIEQGWHPLTAHLRSLPNNPGSPRPFLSRNRTVQQRLDAYKRLIDAAAPGDPDGGGLAADYTEDDGTVHINYWDMADDIAIIRKQFSLWPKGQNDVGMHVAQYKPGKGWEDEGFDFERDFSNSLPDILQAFSVASSALIGALTGNPELAAAWSAVFGAGIKSAIARVPPDPGQVLAGFEAFGGASVKLVGGKIDIGSIFGSPSMRSDFLQSLSGMLSKFRKIAGEQGGVLDFADQLRAALSKGWESLPHVDLAAAIEHGAAGIIPDIFAKEASILANTKLDPRFQLGTTSFNVQLGHTPVRLGIDLREIMAKDVSDGVMYSVRKLADDKPLFDGTYLSVLASQKRQEDFNARIASVSSETFKPALDPFHGVNPRDKLNTLVRALQKRYNLR